MCCMMMQGMDHSGDNIQMAATKAPQYESLPDILKRRYALGEITREQFEEMKRVLGLLDTSSMTVASDEHSHHG